MGKKTQFWFFCPVCTKCCCPTTEYKTRLMIIMLYFIDDRRVLSARWLNIVYRKKLKFLLSVVLPLHKLFKKFFARVATWLILPVVICLSQRLSHACLSSSENKVKPRMAHYISYGSLDRTYYLDNCGNSRANTCTEPQPSWKGRFY